MVERTTTIEGLRTNIISDAAYIQLKMEASLANLRAIKGLSEQTEDVEGLEAAAKRMSSLNSEVQALMYKINAACRI